MALISPHKFICGKGPPLSFYFHSSVKLKNEKIFNYFSLVYFMFLKQKMPKTTTITLKLRRDLHAARSIVS